MLGTNLMEVGLVILSFVTTLFVVSLLIKRNDIADIAWGTGIFLVALVSHLNGPQSQLSLLLTILAAFWGVRLTARLFIRNRKKTEDPRYKVWRDTWGKWFYLRSYLQVYLLQGFLMVVVGYTFIHANNYSNQADFSFLTIVGLVLWLIGYYFEVVGDFQLDKFISNPQNRGRIMDQGLWQYSRHPNYFGEVTMWWGLWLMIVQLPFSWIALISPISITFLILKVSGIPMLEKRMASNPDFLIYQKKTSAFFPLPPKS